MGRSVLPLALALALTPLAAGAHEDAAPAPDAAKVFAALSGAASYRVRVTFRSGPGTPSSMISTVMTSPRRIKNVSDRGAVSEYAVVDEHLYTRDAGDWIRRDRAAAPPDPLHLAAGAGVMTYALPDRIENGAAVGAFTYEPTAPSAAALPAGMRTTTCTYDKTTYLLRTCFNAVMTMKFEGWNDPANHVDVPVVTPAR
jgi:hypothetical protein